MRLMRFLVLIGVAFFVLGCHSSRTGMDETELCQIKESKPLLLLKISISGRDRNEITFTLPNKNIYDVDYDTIFSLFSDGTVIYSGNELGGSPYCTFSLTEDQIETLFGTFKEQQIFEGERRYFYFGLSSGYIRIHLNYNDQTVEYSSWHELFADNPKVVDTEHGIVALEGRDREEVILSRSPEYNEFLRRWNVIRDSVRNLIEENSEAELYSVY